MGGPVRQLGSNSYRRACLGASPALQERRARLVQPGEPAQDARHRAVPPPRAADGHPTRDTRAGQGVIGLLLFRREPDTFFSPVTSRSYWWLLLGPAAIFIRESMTCLLGLELMLIRARDG